MGVSSVMNRQKLVLVGFVFERKSCFAVTEDGKRDTMLMERFYDDKFAGFGEDRAAMGEYPFSTDEPGGIVGAFCRVVVRFVDGSTKNEARFER